MKIAVILPAAGVGKRFADAAHTDPLAPAVNKLEIDLAGRPVFLRAVELFTGRPAVHAIILAVNPDAVDEFRFKWGDALAFHGVKIVAGGKAERWETVQRALTHVPDDATHVAVHDAARPLASSRLIDRVFAAAQRYPAVIPGLPVTATLKRVTDDDEPGVVAGDVADAILGEAGKDQSPVRRVTATIDRGDVVEVQTPQVFEVNLLRRAYAHLTDARNITDDAGLVEALGEPVRVIEGEATNLKITRPGDAPLAAAIFQLLHAGEKKELARKRLFTADDE